MRPISRTASTVARTAGMVLVLFWLMFAATGHVDSQEGTKPDKAEVEGSDPGDGYDRPTKYVRIRFSDKPADGARADADAALKTRVFLLDVSSGMSGKFKPGEEADAKEVTRLSHMVAQMERSLDALAKRKDPRLRFNIVTFGAVQDFAKGGEMQAATADNAKRAKDWLAELKAEGEADMYSMLSECFEQEPDSATLIVGGMPAKPAGVEEAELKKHTSHSEFLLAEVRRWRRSGKKTTLDITGVGLNEEAKAFYRRLAEAAGGTYLDA